MRAVNLIGAGGGRDGRGGQSVGPWAVLGVLGLLVAGMLAYVLTNNQISGDRAQLAALQTQVQAIQTQADVVRPYKEFAALAQARVQTISQLGAARFDWHRTFAELARVIPSDVSLSSLLGTVAPGVGVQGSGAGDTGTLRSALPNPAIELSGCAAGHDGVARLISRLRVMSGVVRVSLSGSTDTTGGAGAAGAGAQASGGCPAHGASTQFGIVVFFQPIPAVPAPTQPDLSGGGAGATPAASATPPAAPAGTATPAASTTPAPSAGNGPTGTVATTPSGTGTSTGTGSAAP